MKRILLAALTLTMVVSTQAQKKWYDNVKFSGYGLLQYQASDQEDKDQNSFNVRLVRMSLDGRAHKDFAWKAQMQINGTTKDDASAIRLVDLFGEWQKYDFLYVKAGQFKRPFTFENPMHPITQGFMSYSQNVTKLSGFSDRTGEHASNGRDIGIQLQGDFLKNIVGRYLLHYQVGVFNGTGINVKDDDKQKDIIGGLWVMPVKGMRIGAFGWVGSSKVNNEKAQKRRYAFSGEYNVNDWTFRSEYIHSYGAGKTITRDGEVFDLGNKADGLYAVCIAPVIKNKMHVKARYDIYRENKTWRNSKTFYEVGADYLFTKNIQMNVEYAFVNDRSISTGTSKENYNMVDVELDIRF